MLRKKDFCVKKITLPVLVMVLVPTINLLILEHSGLFKFYYSGGGLDVLLALNIFFSICTGVWMGRGTKNYLMGKASRIVESCKDDSTGQSFESPVKTSFAEQPIDRDLYVHNMVVIAQSEFMQSNFKERRYCQKDIERIRLLETEQIVKALLMGISEQVVSKGCEEEQNILRELLWELMSRINSDEHSVNSSEAMNDNVLAPFLKQVRKEGLNESN